MTDGAAQSLALALGVSALITVACRRVRIPALLPLMLTGLSLGVSGARVIDAASLGSVLKGFVTIAIGLLIFEGALHLNKEELSRAPRAVWGLLTVGAAITWVGAACGAHWLLGMAWPVAALLGAALTVTGPTVVQPILRMVRVSPSVHTALAAEAVLIDPIGVVATVTTLEIVRLYVAGGLELSMAGEGVWMFAKPLIGGAGVGVAFGVVGYGLLKAVGRLGRPEPQLLNLIAIGVCMTCVGVGEAFTPEAGLAAVTICGVIMARAHVLGATELRSFKELLAVILVGTLFVLLTSRFDVSQLRTLSWHYAAFVGALLLAIRPLAVYVSTIGSRLTGRERLFASTFAPRGIVALSMIAVTAAELSQLTGSAGTPSSVLSEIKSDAARLELVMFITIVGTVLSASVASPVLAWALGLRSVAGSGVVLVGGHPLSLALAAWLKSRHVNVRVIDQNEARVISAISLGIDAKAGDATDFRWMDDIGSLHGAGALLVWTGNHDVDQLVLRWGLDKFGPKGIAIWSSKPAREQQQNADLSRGEPITAWLDRLGDNVIELAESADPSTFSRLLGWLEGGRFTFATKENRVAKQSKNVSFVGLRARAESEATAVPGKAEAHASAHVITHASAQTEP